MIEEKTLLEDVIDWGQGYDDTIIELIDSFQKFRDGYYGLINYGDDWWKQFNQGRDFDEIMKEQWEEFESVDFMNLVEKMAVAIAGTYVRFDDFVDGVKNCYEQGKGLRHKELKGEKKSEQADTEFNHESFYEFLLNVINPNEMEKYRSMFLSSDEIVNGE